ncbi:baseplate J/gp47 family protein [Thermoproteota archaeon]
MTFIRRSYEETRDSILSQITKGVINERHIYDAFQTKYRLEKTPVSEIVKVEGLVGGSTIAFSEGVDYRLTGEMLEWLPNGANPDEKTVFFVNYTIGEPLGLTDVNPGSVVRTIVEAVSREIDFMYAQLNYVYDAGFIDTAYGSSLDLVASILGVGRKPAEPATGMITFGRNTDPGDVSVEQEAHIQDGRSSYTLKNTPVKQIVKIEGNIEESAYEFEQDTDYTLIGNNLEWLAEGKKPDSDSTFYVNYLTYEQITIPTETSISTYTRRTEDAKFYETTEERVLKNTPQGRWEAIVPIKAIEPGKAGNVFAGSIVVMPQPLVGVEYVINRGDILTGVEAETDKELRERAKHALEVAGKATFSSLESAVKGVEGVTSILIEEMPDEVLGVVKIIVQGGSPEDIQRVIDETRAAGIRVEFTRPRIVNIDIALTVDLVKGAVPSSVEKEVESKIRSYLSEMDIGDDIVYNRVVNSAFSVEGVYDVSELTLNAHRDDFEEIVQSTRENIEIMADEMALVREVTVLVKPFDGRGV